MKKYWGDVLSCYYSMSSADLDILIKQSSRDCKVNCIHKGENLYESNPESSAFVYSGSDRGRKRMMRKKSRKELTHNEAPTLTEAAGTHTNTEAATKHMLLLVCDGSKDAVRGLTECIHLVENPDADHIIILTPWNDQLAHNIVEHHLQRQQKSIINEHDSVVLLKAKLREAACAIAHQIADILEHNRPDIDYTLLVPGTQDPSAAASIIAAKYAAEWIVVGKCDEQHDNKNSFGSKTFIENLQRLSGAAKVLVV